MSIITISRGSYSRGRVVAELVAKKLGYTCISREVLLEASEKFNIPEIKLVRAIHDAPWILDRLTQGKRKYLAYIHAALSEHFQKDHVVYHGLAGHFFFKGVSHLLKVRIIADRADRVKLEMEREGISNVEALHLLKLDDEERRKWSLSLFGIDTWDPGIYDIVIRIKKITCDDAADIICHAASLPHFQTTPESQELMDDQAIAAKITAAIIDKKPEVEVSVNKGVARIHIKTMEVPGELFLKKVAREISGVKEVKVDVDGIEIKP